MSKVTFSKNGLFYQQLKKDVDFYFKEKKIKKTGNWKLYFKSAILVTTSVSLYILLLTIKFPVAISLLFCALLGFSLAGVGFNIMHDANHGCFSSKRWVNEISGLTLNALGGNSYLWKYKHFTHHTYTNVDGMDDDIAKSPLLRQCPSQKWFPFHRYQHIYILFLYAFSGFAWITVLDFSKYFRQKVSDISLQMTWRNHFVFWVTKTLYVLFYALIPIYLVGLTPWLTGFICFHMAMGFMLALVFQLAHVVEETRFESTHIEPTLIHNGWAIHQLKSTANFACQNKYINWYVGGLNYQIEHHLFPRISHIHYPAISKIVRAACQENNLPYNYFPTVTSAIVSHFNQIKKLGKKPDELILTGPVRQYSY